MAAHDIATEKQEAGSHPRRDGCGPADFVGGDRTGCVMKSDYLHIHAAIHQSRWLSNTDHVNQLPRTGDCDI